jgi:hypothetical protein
LAFRDPDFCSGSAVRAHVRLVSTRTRISSSQHRYFVGLSHKVCGALQPTTESDAKGHGAPGMMGIKTKV